MTSILRHCYSRNTTSRPGTYGLKHFIFQIVMKIFVKGARRQKKSCLNSRTNAAGYRIIVAPSNWKIRKTTRNPWYRFAYNAMISASYTILGQDKYQSNRNSNN